MNNCKGVAMSDERKLRSLAWLYSPLAPVYDSACGVPFYERARSRAWVCGTLAAIT